MIKQTPACKEIHFYNDSNHKQELAPQRGWALCPWTFSGPSWRWPWASSSEFRINPALSRWLDWGSPEVSSSLKNSLTKSKEKPKEFNTAADVTAGHWWATSFPLPSPLEYCTFFWRCTCSSANSAGCTFPTLSRRTRLPDKQAKKRARLQKELKAKCQQLLKAVTHPQTSIFRCRISHYTQSFAFLSSHCVWCSHVPTFVQSHLPLEVLLQIPGFLSALVTKFSSSSRKKTKENICVIFSLETLSSLIDIQYHPGQLLSSDQLRKVKKLHGRGVVFNICYHRKEDCWVFVVCSCFFSILQFSLAFPNRNPTWPI